MVPTLQAFTPIPCMLHVSPIPPSYTIQIATEQVGVAVMLLTCIREVTVSNLGRDPDYSDFVTSLPSTSPPIHYSPVTMVTDNTAK
jgi:hypothetical protein